MKKNVKKRIMGVGFGTSLLDSRRDVIKSREYDYITEDNVEWERLNYVSYNSIGSYRSKTFPGITKDIMNDGREVISAYGRATVFNRPDQIIGFRSSNMESFINKIFPLKFPIDVDMITGFKLHIEEDLEDVNGVEYFKLISLVLPHGTINHDMTGLYSYQTNGSGDDIRHMELNSKGELVPYGTKDNDDFSKWCKTKLDEFKSYSIDELRNNNVNMYDVKVYTDIISNMYDSIYNVVSILDAGDENSSNLEYFRDAINVILDQHHVTPIANEPDKWRFIHKYEDCEGYSEMIEVHEVSPYIYKYTNKSPLNDDVNVEVVTYKCTAQNYIYNIESDEWLYIDSFDTFANNALGVEFPVLSTPLYSFHMRPYVTDDDREIYYIINIIDNSTGVSYTQFNGFWVVDKESGTLHEMDDISDEVFVTETENMYYI